MTEPDEKMKIDEKEAWTIRNEGGPAFTGSKLMSDDEKLKQISAIVGARVMEVTLDPKTRTLEVHMLYEDDVLPSESVTLVVDFDKINIK